MILSSLYFAEYAICRLFSRVGFWDLRFKPGESPGEKSLLMSFMCRMYIYIWTPRVISALSVAVSRRRLQGGPGKSLLLHVTNVMGVDGSGRVFRRGGARDGAVADYEARMVLVVGCAACSVR